MLPTQLTRFATVVALTLVWVSTAAADDLPRLMKNGEHKCKVSKEYKLRGCRVVMEGDTQLLSLDAGNLLQLEGELHPNDFVGKKKKVFFEARIRDDNPYLCHVKDPKGAKACREQTLLIPLVKKGNTWIGRFPVKMYWDRYVGEGPNRRVEGYVVTAEELSFTLKLSRA